MWKRMTSPLPRPLEHDRVRLCTSIHRLPLNAAAAAVAARAAPWSPPLLLPSLPPLPSRKWSPTVVHLRSLTPPSTTPYVLRHCTNTPTLLTGTKTPILSGCGGPFQWLVGTNPLRYLHQHTLSCRVSSRSFSHFTHTNTRRDIRERERTAAQGSLRADDPRTACASSVKAAPQVANAPSN